MWAWTGIRAGLALTLVASASYAFADAPSGTALAVIQSAQIDTQTGQKILEAEAPVFSGDKIETGPVGEAQILFRDNTKLVVGPNSLMVIDAFVFNDDNTAREITLNAAKGVFRFFTGSSRKDAYSINTPTATIGVRGTEFDISIEKEGTTRVANFEGMTRICRRDAAGGPIDPESCVETKDPCTLSVARPDAPAVTSYNNRDVEFRNRQLKYYFQYIRDQSSLRDDFKVDLKACLFAELPLPKSNPGDGHTPPGGEVEEPDEPLPPTPLPPDFTPPDPPTLPADRHNDRPTHDDRSVFRP